jgi:hypothetical protein
MSMIRFDTKLYTIGSWVILKLPDSASAKLPSRGQVMVKGTINGSPLQTPLEPDGNGSHWLHIDKQLQKATAVKTGDVVSLEIEATKEWPEPDVPADIQRGVTDHPDTQALWQDITPLARWEWIRWIRATGQAETRNRRIEVARSKMMAGERRPCCWNRNLCTMPEVSKNGILLEPTKSK